MGGMWVMRKKRLSTILVGVIRGIGKVGRFEG